MALLTKKQREKRFRYLGLGEYNSANILKFQKKAFPNSKSNQDGIYGQKTDFALRHFYNVKKCAPSFKPEEFKCECGGKYCTGYPSYMKQVELKNLQAIRNRYNRPMIVTCGLRCKTYNSKCNGSIQNSLHLIGRACDFYMAGVTDTLDHRKAFISWAKTLPNTHYIYGNGINSNGYAVYAPYMGNAIHYDVNKAVKTEKKKVVEKEDPLKKWYDTLKVQLDWSKNAKYQWVNPPTVENSRFKKTCIALPCVSLQRLGLLPKGGWFYLNLKTGKINGRSADYVKKHSEVFEIRYPNKSVIALGDKIQKGDIVAYNGGRGHIQVYMGKNSKGQHTFATAGHLNKLHWVSPYFAKRPIKLLVRLKSLEIDKKKK